MSAVASSPETHPETFYDIQEETTASLFYLLVLLVIVYATFFRALLLVVQLIPELGSLGGELGFWTVESQLAFALGAGSALVHFLFAYNRDIRRELIRLGVKTPDPDDQYHEVFENVLDEMRVATCRTDLEGYVLPSRYRTAFSLEDGKRAAVVLSEGTLGVLDRSEIQAVVAHEVAHVAYGDTSLKSFVHNLVSFVDGLNDDALEKVFNTDATPALARSGRLSVGYVGLILLSSIYEGFLRLLQTTISKERERRADATAVEYNRNPLALAKALHKLGGYYRQYTLTARRYRGFSYLRRSDVQSLQIVPVDFGSLDGDGFIDDLFSTHPPLNERLDTLLGLAGEPRENLENVIGEKGTAPYRTDVVETANGDPVTERTYWAEVDGDKHGPMSFHELLEEPFLGEGTKIGYSETGPMKPMGSLSLFRYLFDLRQRGELNLGCPECGGPLRQDRYLGVPLQFCRVCGGIGVSDERMLRIVCRYRSGSDELSGDVDDFSHPPAYDEEPREDFEPLGDCPGCGGEFEKSFYTPHTSLVLDECENCDYLWFERGDFRAACELN